jgi:hypothetical protein
MKENPPAKAKPKASPSKRGAVGKKATKACLRFASSCEPIRLLDSFLMFLQKLGREELVSLFKALSESSGNLRVDALSRAARRMGLQEWDREDCLDMLKLFSSNGDAALTLDEFLALFENV